MPSAPFDAPASNGRLTAAEIEDLVAFGEALVAGLGHAAPERRFLLEHIEDRARNPKQLSAYRTAASTLVRLAGRPLATLEIRERQQLIVRHTLVGSIDPSGEDAGAPTDEVHVIRTQVVRDLIRGYYASPAGWAIVGYETTFPGRCGDLAGYTRAGS